MTHIKKEISQNLMCLEHIYTPRYQNGGHFLKLRGSFVNIMCDINPEHKDNVIYKRNQQVLHTHLLRDIYRYIESALQWYNIYPEKIQKKGYMTNPYDSCVAKKRMQGKQCTIIWYEYDNKESHMSQKVNCWANQWFESTFWGSTNNEGK